MTDKQITVVESKEMSAETYQAITMSIKEIIAPVMQSFAEAISQIASSQQTMTDRIVALEKQVRLGNKVSKKQAQYITDAIKQKAKETLSAMNIVDDKKAISQLKCIIRKSILSQWGVGSISDLPSCEYQVVMSQIDLWYNTVKISEVMMDYRKRMQKGG